MLVARADDTPMPEGHQAGLNTSPDSWPDSGAEATDIQQYHKGMVKGRIEHAWLECSYGLLPKRKGKERREDHLHTRSQWLGKRTGSGSSGCTGAERKGDGSRRAFGPS